MSTVGLAVGCVTPVKDLLFGEDPPLGFFTESLSIMAGGMIPSMMLVLGSVLHKGPGSAKVPKRVIFGILATRQIIIPILGKIHMLSIKHCINPKYNPPSPALPLPPVAFPVAQPHFMSVRLSTLVFKGACCYPSFALRYTGHDKLMK